ncbi:MAG: YHYH protein [Alphaproteobacteria bacterium]|nr:YHYH protein [Alphaproteobacteria bacterium]MBU0860143.1 YHYH protein [Alphaproteobacteria bacterium]
MTLGANEDTKIEKYAATSSNSNRCAAVKSSVEDAGFSDSVTVKCDEEHAYMSSDVYPDHDMMTGIVNTNEQVPVPAKEYAAPVRLSPRLTNTPVTRDSSLGVAVNGVPIFDYTGGGEMSIEELYHHQTQHDTILTQQLDECGGHAGRGDDYHYHKSPNCMIEQMKNAGDNAIIGWAFDGFPIYGDKNPDGSEIPEGVLDVCNGQPDETYGYRYHTSKGAPYIIQCLMGQAIDMKDLPRVSPLKASNESPQKTTGRPPRGGVKNLQFIQSANGKRSMTYSYEGEDYYIRYEPSNIANCYNFESRTVTDALVKKGEYCR